MSNAINVVKYSAAGIDDYDYNPFSHEGFIMGVTFEECINKIMHYYGAENIEKLSLEIVGYSEFGVFETKTDEKELEKIVKSMRASIEDKENT